MSNISLGGNNGTSINFDGAALQSKEEDEYRREEEQQQNELRALLTNAFDDLIDEDDILSITSEEGTDSRNVSLVRRHSSDSLNKLNTEENKIHEVPENDRDFSQPSASSTQVGFPFLPHQQPRFGQFEPLSRTQEFPKGQLDLLRASVESLPNFPLSQNRHEPADLHSNAGNHGNRDNQDSDYHSVEEKTVTQGKGHGGSKVKGKGDGSRKAKNNNNEGDTSERHSAKQSAERENLIRKSIEDFQQLQEAYEQQQQQQQQQEQYYSNHGNQPGHNHYHSAEQPYDQNTVQGQHDQGQFYQGHDPAQGGHHGYDPHYLNHHQQPHNHHHFRNIYENRPYHTIGEREETEGGNVQRANENQFYQVHPGYGVPDHHGYYHNAITTQGQGQDSNFSPAYNTTDHGFYSHATGASEPRTAAPTQTTPHRRILPEPKRDNNGGHPKESQKDNTRSNPNQNQNSKDINRDKGLSQSQTKKEISENYKVSYKKKHGEKRERQEEEKETSEPNLEKDFMDQGGDNQQMAQLQILYKARGRKIEELTNELEVVKGEASRELRILKHQLSVAKGEREGAARSLESVQDLLQETKGDNSTLVGRVNASEAQIEGLKKAKEDLINKLQTAESTIETLHQHLDDLGSSDTLTRARHDHEIVIGGLQKKYETEIKLLQEKVEVLNEQLLEKDSDIKSLKQKLSDSVKQSEREQVSRADTINCLTQSLEESQKRCRNLLESTTAHDMSQMKIQLQQALASKSISDEICSSLQDEIQDLKEQVQMYESASSLGISVSGPSGTHGGQHGHSGYTDQNDSMADLGIKKTLDYDTPQSTPTNLRSRSHSNNSSNNNDVVASLKSELERCLVNNRQKRSEVTELKDELKVVKKEMLEFKQRCEGAELQAQEHKKRVADLEFCLNPGDKVNAIENRLKKDIENLKREKKILLEDVEDLQKRLEDVSKSEEKLTELNRELSHQISDMVKEYDQDKREAIDRTQRACEQVSETSRTRLMQELTMQFDSEQAAIIAQYEKEVAKLTQALKEAQEEIDKVKDVYVQLCSEKDNLQETMEKEWTERMEKNVLEVKQSMKKEEELALLRVEETWAKDKDAEVNKVREELEQALGKLKAETASELKSAQEKFENELKTIKDIMEIEKSNELEKMNKEKLNEIEKLKQSVGEKEKILDLVKTDKSELVDMLKVELETKICEANTLKKTLEGKEAEMNKLRDETDASVKKIKNELDERMSDIDVLKKELCEKENVIEKLKGDIVNISGEQNENLNAKASEVEHLKQEMELMLSKVETDRIQEVNSLRKDIEEVYKEKDSVIEELRAEVEKIQKEKDLVIEKLNTDIESIKKEKDTTIGQLKADIENIQKEKDSVINELRSEIEKLQKQKDSETEKHDETEKDDNLRIEIVKNMQKDKQVEIDHLKKEIIRLKLEMDRNETDKQLEIDKVCRVKQAEIENLEKRRQSELDRFKKEKRMEMERLKKSKEDEINRLMRMRGGEKKDEEDVSAKVRERLNREMEEDLNRSLDTKVAMSKVVWLEEHRATRQAAIDNAVRLAESELKLRMEDELEAKLEQRLEEAKIMWQNDSLHQLDDERQNWDTLKEEEIADRLEKEHKKWRNTELQSALQAEQQKWGAELESRLEAERQKWGAELEAKIEAERQSWVEVELETERLSWAAEWEGKISAERDSWHVNVLEPAKRKWRMEAEERLKAEKDNWRCMELEPEKLNLLRECEERIAKEKQTWKNRDLPAELEKEKKKWHSLAGEQLRKEQERWRKSDLPREVEKEKKRWKSEDLPREVQKAREQWKNEVLPREVEKAKRQWQSEVCPREIEKAKQGWVREMEGRLEEERTSWKSSELPEEIEKERRRWMKLMETTLAKEKENWKTKDLPAELARTRQELERSMESEVESQVLQKLESEKEKLQKDSELKVLEAIEEHQAACKKELKETLEKERETLKLKYDEELQERFQAEKKIWKEMVDQELLQKLEVEREKWRRKSESDYNKKLETEKEKMKFWIRKDLEKRVEEDKVYMREDYEREFKNKLNEEMSRLREKYDNEAKEDFEHIKVQVAGDARQDFERMKMQVEEEMLVNFEKEKELMKHRSEKDFEQMKMQIEEELQMNFEKEKELMKHRSERELTETIESEKEKWKSDFEKELSQRVHAEEEKWKQMIENDIERRLAEEKEKWDNRKKSELEQRLEVRLEERLAQEREKWKARQGSEFEEKLWEEKEKWKTRQGSEFEEKFETRLSEEKKRWREVWDEQKIEEMGMMTQQFQDRMRSDLEEEVEKLRVQVEHEFHMRVEHEVDLAVQEARDDWHREYTMEMSINTTSAEASQGLLREEIETLKSRAESLQSELMHKEEVWLKEKEDLILHKDLERRDCLEKLQCQTESEYKQFIDEHQQTLDKALKASREQHTKDKIEMEERYLSQIKLIQAREKTLQAQLQDTLQGTEEQSTTLAEVEKDRILWFEERDRLLQDIADRDSLLGKADVHLSKEIDKLRTELQAAYQRRLEAETASYKQKIEADLQRSNNSEHKEKLQLEKQLSEVTTELNKTKSLNGEEKAKFVEELKKIKSEHFEEKGKLMDEMRKEKGKVQEELRQLGEKLRSQEIRVEESSRTEGELKKAKELLKGYKDEVMEAQESCQRRGKEVEDLQNKLTQALQAHQLVQAELNKMKEEKTKLIESVQSIEASYRKDVALYKQRQDEANNRILKTEKILQDMKQKYRSELESLRKALEAENDVAMNAMKNKMIELQKKHVAFVDEMRKKHAQEREQLTKGQSVRGVTPQPNKSEVDEIDQAVKELRSQYLDTVHKIKGDVLRHITETNVRAAETVKQEMDRERVSTFNQIKDFYRHNVKQILETEIVGSNLETKLLAVEEALDNLSSNPSSRSATPEDFVEERQFKSRSLSNLSSTRDAFNRDAGISPKSQRTVTFTPGTRDDRSGSKTPTGVKDTSFTSTTKSDGKFEDPRSPKSRLGARSPREALITIRGETSDVPNLRSNSTRDWVYQSGKESSFDTRLSENRPVSAKSHRELRDTDSRTGDRPLSAKSPRDLHYALREKGGRSESRDDYVDRDRERNGSGDKKKSRMLISTRDIHSGRYNGNPTRPAEEEVTVARSKSVTSVFAASSALYRPTSVPDLATEDKELKVWTENNNDTYRYTPLRDTLKSGTNLHRSNSKSESDLSIAEKNFKQLQPAYDSNLDLSTGSLTSIDSFFTPRKRDAGETPTSTPRRHGPRKHYTMHSFPTGEQLTKDLMGQNQSLSSKNNTANVSSPLSTRSQSAMNVSSPLSSGRSQSAVNLNSPMSSNGGRSQSSQDRKNLPLIQFRHGKMQMQGLQRVGVGNSKSPHPDEAVLRDTPPTRDTSNTPDRVYRPLSVSSNLKLDF